jgi:ferredoxin
MNFPQLPRHVNLRDMANRNETAAGNVPGAFYVDTTCIDCDQCRISAPTTFRRDDEIGQSVVFHQPMTAAELAEATEAMDDCPTSSIGNDGIAN